MLTSTSSGFGQPSFDASRPTSDSDRSALGELLRSHRERRGLTLQQIAAETKIPLRHLQALEGDNLSMVPAGLYQRAEIRAYARAVRLDASLAIAQLEHDLRSAGVHSVAPAPSVARQAATSRKSILAAIGVVAVMLVLSFATRERDTVVGGEGQPSTAGRVQPPQTPVPEPTAVESPTYSEPAPSRTPTAPPQSAVTSTPAQPPALDFPVSTAGSALDQGATLSPNSQSELVITSEPAGARVTIDGVGWGDTPVTVRHLPSGAKRIRVTKGGYQSEERVVPVAETRRSTLHISLHTQP